MIPAASLGRNAVKMFARAVCLGLVGLLSLVVWAQDAKEPASKPVNPITTEAWFNSFEAREYKDKDGTLLLYRIVRPEKADPAAKTPLLIFLHGSASKGNDNIGHVRLWRDFALNASKQGMLVVVPQCPIGTAWFAQLPTRPAAKDADPALSRVPLKCLVDALPELQKEFNIDPDRMYISGWSMGGGGCWTLMREYPGKFAAAAIFAGCFPQNETVETVKIFTKTPIWIFQGALDASAKPEWARTMVDLLKQAGGNPKYTEFPKEPHDLRGGVYAEKDLIPWLLSQKLPAATSKP